MFPFWILLKLRTIEVASGDNWSYKTCKAPVKSLPPTNQHQTFSNQIPFPVTQPTVSQHWREKVQHSLHLLTPVLKEGIRAAPNTGFAFGSGRIPANFPTFWLRPNSSGGPNSTCKVAQYTIILLKYYGDKRLLQSSRIINYWRLQLACVTRNNKVTTDITPEDVWPITLGNDWQASHQTSDASNPQ